MKTIIIDDEYHARELLKSMISENCSEIEIIGEAAGVKEGIALLKQKTPDLLLLDIKMNDGNGFEILEHFKTEQFLTIFTTAYDDFAIKAFKYNAFDYLVKPIDLDELINSIKRVQNKKPPPSLDSFLEVLRIMETKKRDRLIIPDNKGYKSLKIDEIIYCESDNSYSTFYLNNDESIISSKPIIQYEPLLYANGFFRIHRSYIINLDCIKEYIRQGGGYVMMDNGIKLKISSRRKKDFLDRFLSQ